MGCGKARSGVAERAGGVARVAGDLKRVRRGAMWERPLVTAPVGGVHKKGGLFLAPGRLAPIVD